MIDRSDDFYKLHLIDFPPGTPVEVRLPTSNVIGVVEGAHPEDYRFILVKTDTGSTYTFKRDNVFGRPVLAA